MKGKQLTTIRKHEPELLIKQKTGNHLPEGLSTTL